MVVVGIPSARLTWKLPRPISKTWLHLQRPSGSFHVSLKECAFYMFASCGLVVEIQIHLAARIHFFAPLPMSTKFGVSELSVRSSFKRRPWITVVERDVSMNTGNVGVCYFFDTHTHTEWGGGVFWDWFKVEREIEARAHMRDSPFGACQAQAPTK